MIKIKILLALSVLGIFNSASAQAGYLYTNHSSLSLYNDTNENKKNIPPLYSYKIEFGEPYYKSIVTIQKSLLKLNNIPSVTEGKSIEFLDLQRYRILEIDNYFKKYRNIEGNKFKFNNILVTIKTDINHKANLLIENLSKDDCMNLIYAFKNNSFEKIYLNNHVINQEKNFNCLIKNTIKL